MRRIALLVLVLLVAALAPLGAQAACQAVSTGPLNGTVCANEGGYVVSADGAAGNPDPTDGYISVSNGGQVCADDNGAPGNSTSPTCAP